LREKRTKIAFKKKNEKQRAAETKKKKRSEKLFSLSLSVPSSHTKREEARLARTGAEREYSAETERS